MVFHPGTCHLQHDFPSSDLQVDQRVQRLDRDRNDDELARLLKKHEEVGDLGNGGVEETMPLVSTCPFSFDYGIATTSWISWYLPVFWFFR